MRSVFIRFIVLSDSVHLAKVVQKNQVTTRNLKKKVGNAWWIQTNCLLLQAINII